MNILNVGRPKSSVQSSEAPKILALQHFIVPPLVSQCPSVPFRKRITKQKGAFTGLTRQSARHVNSWVTSVAQSVARLFKFGQFHTSSHLTGNMFRSEFIVLFIFSSGWAYRKSVASIPSRMSFRISFLFSVFRSTQRSREHCSWQVWYESRQFPSRQRPEHGVLLDQLQELTSYAHVWVDCCMCSVRSRASSEIYCTVVRRSLN